MRIVGVLFLLGFLSAAQARAADPLRLSYHTYAVGLHIADVEASLGIGPWTYQASLAFQTTGLVGAFYHSHHASTVHGTWVDDRPRPAQYAADGFWRGEARVTRIDYTLGMPLVRELKPPLEPEREAVAPELRQDSTDSLSALATLIRTIAGTGRCESTIRTFDGRRAAELTARTGGQDTLDKTGRSAFRGPALRCEFVSRMLAGFRFDESSQSEFRPLKGAAWFAWLTPDGGPVPVRMTIETRWFGQATSYLTAVDQRDTPLVGQPVPSGR